MRHVSLATLLIALAALLACAPRNAPAPSEPRGSPQREAIDAGAGPARAIDEPLPVATLPKVSLAHSKRASIKTSPDAGCAVPTPSDASLASTLDTAAASCGSKGQFRPFDSPFRGGSTGTSSAVTVAFTAEAGRCYRVVLSIEKTIGEVALFVRDSDGAIAAEELGHGSVLALPSNGALCFSSADPNASIVVSVGSGGGEFALQRLRD